jgi:hypothetical protein
MSNAYLLRMPVGIAGQLTAAEHATVENAQFDASYPCLLYGILTKIVSGKCRPIASGDTIASLLSLAFLVRPYPINDVLGAAVGSEALGQGTPPIIQPADRLKRGYIVVKVTANGSVALADIVEGLQVYVRTAAAIGPALGSVGDLESGTITGNQAVPGAFFMGAADSNGLAVIGFNI